jgi:hypothetical protein
MNCKTKDRAWLSPDLIWLDRCPNSSQLLYRKSSGYQLQLSYLQWRISLCFCPVSQQTQVDFTFKLTQNITAYQFTICHLWSVLQEIFLFVTCAESVTVAARFKAWTIFVRCNAGIVGSNPIQYMDVCVCVYSVFVLSYV